MVSQSPDTSATESELPESAVMVEEESKPIRLSREDLYELAWSKPISSLAQDFGISDVALAKRCRRLGIPIPGRGYWARVAAGQTPYRPVLPSREPEDATEIAITTEAPRMDSGGYLAGEDEPPSEQVAIRTTISSLKTVPTVDLSATTTPVMRTAKHWRHPRRAELSLARGEKSGPIVALSWAGLCHRATGDHRDRARGRRLGVRARADRRCRHGRLVGWN